MQDNNEFPFLKVLVTLAVILVVFVPPMFFEKDTLEHLTMYGLVVLEMGSIIWVVSRRLRAWANDEPIITELREDLSYIGLVALSLLFTVLFWENIFGPYFEG
jgi:hypothetical protein